MTLAAGGGVGGAVGWGVAPGCGVGLGRAVGFGVDLGVGLAVGVGATVGRAVAGCPGVGPAVGDAGTVGAHDAMADDVGSPDDDGDAGPNEHPPSATTRMRTRFEIRRGIGITQSTVGAGARRAYGHRPRKRGAERPDRCRVRDVRLSAASRMAVGGATPRSYRAVTR
jgi:hypothetical protein